MPNPSTQNGRRDTGKPLGTAGIAALAAALSADWRPAPKPEVK